MAALLTAPCDTLLSFVFQCNKILQVHLESLPSLGIGHFSEELLVESGI